MVLRIGHRGAAGYEPENTIRSFEAALRLGADMVELDVHICCSGELVVIHDETVDRTTDGSGSVRDMTLRELKALDAGKGERIPTLEESLSKLHQAAVNIELKGLGTAEPVHDLLKGLEERGDWPKEKILVTSFDWNMLNKVRTLSATTQIGPLTYEDMENALKVASELDAYSINPYHLKINKDFVEDAHNRSIKVYPWTVNEPTEIRRIMGFEVDGIISDFPDRIL